MRTFIQNLYSRLAMKTYVDKSFMGKLKLLLIPTLEYILFPEFRKKPAKNLRRPILVTLILTMAVSMALEWTIITRRNKELSQAYKRIAIVSDSARSLFLSEEMDSLRNCGDYIRYEIYSASNIVVPNDVPVEQLRLIINTADSMEVPLGIYVRVINHESRFVPSAVNDSSGAFGYMQMMPTTFRWVYGILGLKGGKTPENNLLVGAKLLSLEFKKWKKRGRNDKVAWEMSLACYGMGDSIPELIGRVPSVMKPYVDYVMQGIDINSTN